MGLFIVIVKFIDDVEIVNWITRQCVGIHLLVMLWGSWNFCIYSQQWLVGDRCLWKNKGDGEKESMWLFSCYLIVLFSSFVLFFCFLNNKSSSPQFSFMCRGQVWSTLPYKLLILIMYSLKLDQSNSFQFSFCDWLWSHPCFCLLLCFFHNGWETRIFLLFYDHQYIGINLNVKSKSILFLNKVKN